MSYRNATFNEDSGDNLATILLDLLAAVFAGPDESCSHLVGEQLPAFGAEVSRGTVPEPLERPLAEFLAAWTTEAPEAFCAALEPEYVRLFVNTRGGVAAPPYESCWPETGQGGLMGPAARAMARRLDAAGLAVDAAEPPDHLCVELEYLMLLRRQEAGEAADFARELGAWVARFAEAARAAEPAEAYRTALTLLEAVLAYSAEPATSPPESFQP
jgi:TorA-specific chaperone